MFFSSIFYLIILVSSRNDFFVSSQLLVDQTNARSSNSKSTNASSSSLPSPSPLLGVHLSVVGEDNVDNPNLRSRCNRTSPKKYDEATVIEHRDTWYDDGGLTKILCEEEADPSDEQPEILDECCACDEAKYEVIFEGIWSKYTHPKEFPANFWLTHFSDIIGASHSNDFRMWEYGGYASEGLQQVAELGVTKKLEAELKAESNKIRTIIKARGLWHPNLNGKTFAVFRADRKHHLMSLVSMLGPSPDWIVGVSALELCLSNCSWASEKVINLYLWDSGTDSGISYLSPNQPTEPRERIRKITSLNPNNPDSPFYDPNGTRMKPFAKLTVTRQRMYEKPCDEDNDVGVNRNPESIDHDDSKPECQTTEWTDWSVCSASCGQGVRIRTRNYVSVQKSRTAGCSATLIEKNNCDAACVGEVSCATTPWSEWSDCSVMCGKGYRIRTRLFVNREARKVCSQVDLVDTDPCFGVISECAETNLDQIDPKCMVTEWSEWSPCTASCGQGVKARTRLYINPNVQNVCNVDLIQKAPCIGDRPECSLGNNYANNNNLSSSSFNQDSKVPASAFSTSSYDFGKAMNTNNNRIDRTSPPQGLQQPRNPGSYGGGGAPVDCVVTPWGPWTECSKTCGRAQKTRRRMIKVFPQNGGQECPTKLVQRRRCKENPPCPTKAKQVKPVDCVLSDWSPWTECSRTCGAGGGIKFRQRDIVQLPENGGEECGVRIERAYCSNLPPCS